MLGIEAVPSDKEGAEPTQQTAPAHHGLLGDNLDRESAHFWVGLDPLWVSQVAAPCTSLVGAHSMETLDIGGGFGSHPDEPPTYQSLQIDG